MLFRVQDLQHRTGRISPEVRSHLIYLIDHEDGACAACIANSPDDGARHCSHVGASMAQVVSVIAYPCHAGTDAVPAEGTRDPLTQACLADPRVTGEA